MPIQLVQPRPVLRLRVPETITKSYVVPYDDGHGSNNPETREDRHGSVEEMEQLEVRQLAAILMFAERASQGLCPGQTLLGTGAAAAAAGTTVAARYDLRPAIETPYPPAGKHQKP